MKRTSNKPPNLITKEPRKGRRATKPPKLAVGKKL